VQGRNFSYSYPSFGMTMDERTYNNENYRFGFNGQEKDTDIGEGDYYAFKYRIHDTRLGRFLSTDPLAPEYPWNSTYSYAENSVICCIDIEGLEMFYCADGSKLGKLGDNQQIKVVSREIIEGLAPKYHKKSVTVKGRTVVVNDVNNPIKYSGNEKFKAGQRAFNNYLHNPVPSNNDPILPPIEGSKAWLERNSHKINLFSNEADVILTSMATEINGGKKLKYTVEFDVIFNNGETDPSNKTIKLDAGRTDFENYYSSLKTLFHEYQHYLDNISGKTPIKGTASEYSRHLQIELSSVAYVGKSNLSQVAYQSSESRSGKYLFDLETKLNLDRSGYKKGDTHTVFNKNVTLYNTLRKEYNKTYGKNAKSNVKPL